MIKYVMVVLAGIAAGLVIALRAPLSVQEQPVQHAPISRQKASLRDNVDALIKGLRSPDPVARSIFHRNLIEETGMFFGFSPTAFPEERRETVERWERWWVANRDKTRRQWLIDSLSLEGYAGKRLALKKLAEMSSKSAIPAIVRVLDDPLPELRLEAALALGRLEATAAVDRLADLLESDSEISVRRGAARALGQIGSEKALLPLAKTAAQKDALLRIEAASALLLRAPGQALPVLHSLLVEGNEHARLFAVSRLGDLRRAESVPHLARLLGTQEPSAEEAHKALQKIVGKDLGSRPSPWMEWYEQYKKQMQQNPM
jgi:HEAT repeat protein